MRVCRLVGVADPEADHVDPGGALVGGAAVTAFLRGAESPLVVELEGGELQVAISPDLDVQLDGWAEPVFAGELSPELIQALAELNGE